MVWQLMADKVDLFNVFLPPRQHKLQPLHRQAQVAAVQLRLDHREAVVGIPHGPAAADTARRPRSAAQARDEVDDGREDDRAEQVGQQRVPQDSSADHRVLQVSVGDLEGHPERE